MFLPFCVIVVVVVVQMVVWCLSVCAIVMVAQLECFSVELLDPWITRL